MPLRKVILQLLDADTQGHSPTLTTPRRKLLKRVGLYLAAAIELATLGIMFGLDLSVCSSNLFNLTT